MIILFACLVDRLDSSPIEIKKKLRQDLQKPAWAGINNDLAPRVPILKNQFSLVLTLSLNQNMIAIFSLETSIAMTIHGFRQAELDYGGLVLGSCQYCY